MSSDTSSLQLIFAGEVLDGFSPTDVRQRLAQRLKLDEARLLSLFSGQRVIIERGLDTAAATRWVIQFREMGALLHIVGETPRKASPAVEPTLKVTPESGPSPTVGTLSLVPTAPAPVRDPYAAPAPAPIAVNTAPSTEEITCPNCGDRQPKRILCRSCVCDMPRGIAAREEEAAAERERRREEAMVRRGVRRPTGQRSAPTSSLGISRYDTDNDETSLWGLSFDGRIGRLRYLLGGVLSWILMVWLGLVAATLPNWITLSLLLFGLAFIVVWGCRLTALRLHDVDRSAWWMLLLFIPYLGAVVSLALLFWPGNDDDNTYGATPSPQSPQPLIAALLALCVSSAIVVKTGWSAFQRQLEKMQEESETYEGDEVDDLAALPPASELIRVLRSDAAVDEFHRYMSSPGHRAFVVSNGGAWGWHAGAARPDQAIETATADCERRRAPYTPTCHLVHLNDSWAIN